MWKPGAVLQDRNGYGAVDFVDARLVVGDQPGEDDIAAAPDVAARLGFETSAMNLPIGRSDELCAHPLLSRYQAQMKALDQARKSFMLSPFGKPVIEVVRKKGPANPWAGIVQR